jgi:hypothetical protein
MLVANFGDSYKEQYLLKTVRNSLLTALVMDTLGVLFSDFKSAEIKSWLQTDRTVLPKSKRTRKASFNTDFSVLLLHVFKQTTPIFSEDLHDYKRELTEALQIYYYAVGSMKSDNRYVRTVRGEPNTGISLPVGLLLGMYASCVFMERSMLYDLVEVTCRCLGLKSRDRDDVRMLAFLSYQLANHGYFGYQHFQELFSHRAVPAFMYRICRELMRNHSDLEYLSEPFASHVCGSMSYAEYVTVESMYYLCRVDSSFLKELLPSGPKDQLIHVFHTQGADLADVAFIYGGLCTLSEQNYSLVTKPLREGVSARRIVDDFFQAIA